jgi:hypothetical protein
MNFVNSLTTNSVSLYNLHKDLNDSYVSTEIELERNKCRNKIRFSTVKFIGFYIIIPLLIIILFSFLQKNYGIKFNIYIYIILIFILLYSSGYLSYFKRIKDLSSYFYLNNEKNIEIIKKCNF